jgi:pentatricopeptide repeat protein
MQEEIQRLEELRSGNPRGHTFARLADLYRKSGQPLQGLAVVEAGIEHHPHYLNAHLVHAKILRELGRRQEAEAAFGRVLEIDEENLVALRAIEDLNRPGPAVSILSAATPPKLGVVRADDDEASVEPRTASASDWLAQLEAEWQQTRDPAANGAGAVGEPSAEPVREELAEAPAEEPAEAPSEEPAEAPVEASIEAPVEEPENAATEVTEVSERVEAGARIDAPPTPGSTDVAEPDAESAAEPDEDPAVAMATATLAELYCRQGLYEEAISVYEKLLARDPYNAQLAASLDDTRRLSRRGHRRRGGTSPTPPIPGPVPVPDLVHDPVPATSRPSDSSRVPSSPRDPVEPTGTLTIREHLTSIMEGRAQVSPSPGPGAAERLRRWLIENMGAEGD